MNGFLFKKLEWPCRVLICIGGLLMMDPTAITDVIGIVLFAAVFAWQYFGAKKERAAAWESDILKTKPEPGISAGFRFYYFLYFLHKIHPVAAACAEDVLHRGPVLCSIHPA